MLLPDRPFRIRVSDPPDVVRARFIDRVDSSYAPPFFFGSRQGLLALRHGRDRPGLAGALYDSGEFRVCLRRRRLIGLGHWRPCARGSLVAEGGDTLIHGTAAFNGGWWIRLFELSLLTLAFSILLWAGGSSAVSKWPQLSTRETVRAVSTGFLMVAGAGWGIWSLFRQLTSGEADLDELVVTLRDHLARS